MLLDGARGPTAPALTPADVARGCALADLLVRRQDWCHRKVETLRLQEGAHGRRSIALDCTPPLDPRLAWGHVDRSPGHELRVDDAVAVPLAFVTKGALRHLDVTDASGRLLPVLGPRESSRAAASVLYGLIAPGGAQAEPVLGLVRSVVAPDQHRARAAVAQLLGGGAQPDGSGVALRGPVRDLASTLADSTLLIALLPAGDAGRRQVIRYRFHAAVTPAGDPAEAVSNRLRRASLRVACAFGYAGAPVDLPVPGAADAADYALEVHAPAGLRCDGLTLPPAPGAQVEDDASYGSVAHASGAYRYVPGTDARTGEPRDAARLRLAVPVAGLRLTAALGSACTAAVFGLGQALPQGRAALDGEREGGVAVLLALAAMALGLLARRGDNPVTAAVLLPLRVVVMLCAVLLGAGACSLVVGLGPPYVDVLWWSAAAIATLVAVPLVAALPEVSPRTVPGARRTRRDACAQVTTIEQQQYRVPAAGAHAVPYERP